MSGSPGTSTGRDGTPTKPKAITNLAKRPSEDVTRRGTSKMKFTPVLPVRRKKEEPKPETKIESPAPSQNARGRGRGGAARGRGRGDARGGAPREMVATGPLALGPTMTGSSAARRAAAPRSNFVPVTPHSSGAASSASGTATPNAPSLKREPSSSDAGKKLVEIEAGTYSDPDEGVEIIDMDDVRRMDWMAPESLRKEKTREKKKRAGTVKRERSRDKGKVKAEPQDVVLEEEEEAEEDQEVDHANALDLSESEEEEELENIFNDFALQEEDQDIDINVRQEKLYFFQFPEPFPIFVPPQSQSQPQPAPQPQSQDVTMEDATATPKPTDKNKDKVSESPGKGKKVSFAPDVKPPASGANTPTPSVDVVKKEESPIAAVPVDGVIGRLEIHQSGAVKMRMENGILLDVTAATQPSFLQHAVHVDIEKKRLSVIGEVNRRFVVSPNIDALLEALEVTDGEVAMEVDPAKSEEGSAKTGEDRQTK